MMETLTTNRRMLTWLSICSANETQSKWNKSIYIAFSLAAIAIEVIGFSSSLVFFLKNVSSDINAALFAFMQMIAMLGTIYAYISALVSHYKIREMIQHLVDIYVESNENRSNHLKMKKKIIIFQKHFCIQVLKKIHSNS